MLAEELELAVLGGRLCRDRRCDDAPAAVDDERGDRETSLGALGNRRDRGVVGGIDGVRLAPREPRLEVLDRDACERGAFGSVLPGEGGEAFEGAVQRVLQPDRRARGSRGCRPRPSRRAPRRRRCRSPPRDRGRARGAPSRSRPRAAAPRRAARSRARPTRARPAPRAGAGRRRRTGRGRASR